MNIEITAYVDVPDGERGNAEIDRIATRFADVLAGRYRMRDDHVVRSLVVVKSLPRRWARISGDQLVERMCTRGVKILVPAKKDPRAKETT